MRKRGRLREGPCGDAPDLLNGTRVELSCPSPPVQYGAQSFAQGSDDKYFFDATGRAVNHVAGSNTFRTVQTPPRSPTNKNWNVTTTTSSAYDAENHLHAFHPVKVTTITDADTYAVTTTTVDHGATTLGWGPSAHPVSVQNLWNGDNVQPDTTLHWDGDVLLFVTNASGAVVDFKVGIDGEISPTDAAFSGLIAFDRDQAGMVLQCNSTSGSSGFVNPDESTFAAGVPCGPGGPGFTVPLRSYVSYIRADGISGLPVQISGVRAYDPTLGTWTTPDAFEGDVHDPASQQKYMWNRGNPIEYGDPTGYDSLLIIDPNAVGGAGGHMMIVVYDPATLSGMLYSAHPPNGEISGRLVIDKSRIADVSKLGQRFPGDEFFHGSATREQDKIVVNFLDNKKALAEKGKINYNGISNNCATICADALGAAHETLAGSVGLWPILDRVLLDWAKVDPATLQKPNGGKR